MDILQRSYLKLADTKKGKRVWIQGLRLEEAGYHIGTCYEVNYDDDNARVTLTITNDGSNKMRGAAESNPFSNALGLEGMVSFCSLI